MDGLNQHCLINGTFNGYPVPVPSGPIVSQKSVVIEVIAQNKDVPKHSFVLHFVQLVKEAIAPMKPPDQPILPNQPPQFKIYRESELKQARAALLAEGALCLWGEEGCGKSVLANAIVRSLRDEGYLVAQVEPSTPKQMLCLIAEQFGLETYTLEGKQLSLDGLKILISDFLFNNSAVLVIDDAQMCKPDFRHWLKKCKKRGGCNLLLLATNPPLADIFLSVPRIQLRPMPEKAIREIMVEAAYHRGIKLSDSELSRLQSRSGGNPTLAIRSIEEEYLGIDQEAADHRRYFDITPLILIAGTFFVVVRFIGLGTSNRSLYILGGIGGAVFIGLSRVIYSLPKEGKRVS